MLIGPLLDAVRRSRHPAPAEQRVEAHVPSTVRRLARSDPRRPPAPGCSQKGLQLVANASRSTSCISTCWALQCTCSAWPGLRTIAHERILPADEQAPHVHTFRATNRRDDCTPSWEEVTRGIPGRIDPTLRRRPRQDRPGSTARALRPRCNVLPKPLSSVAGAGQLPKAMVATNVWTCASFTEVAPSMFEV